MKLPINSKKYARMVLMGLFISFVIGSPIMHTHAQTDGGVSIVDGEITPHPSAMLDVISNEKGLLIPRVTDLNAVDVTAVTPDSRTSDGLLVFLTDGSQNPRGFYYYDYSAGQWVQLVAGNSTSTFPIGGIIMWSGALGDIPTGWALCDGQNNTPDLRGRFVVGVTTPDASPVGSVTANDGDYREDQGKYNTYGPDPPTNPDHYTLNGGGKTITLKLDAIPSHNHMNSTALPDGKHTHGLTGASTDQSGTHGHAISGSISGGAHYHNSYGIDKSGDQNRDVLGHAITSYKNPSNRESYQVTEIDGSHSHNHSLSISSSSGTHGHALQGNVEEEQDHTHDLNITPNGSNQAHENRPPYYVLAYIMRIN